MKYSIVSYRIISCYICNYYHGNGSRSTAADSEITWNNKFLITVCSLWKRKILEVKISAYVMNRFTNFLFTCFFEKYPFSESQFSELIEICGII